MVNKRFSIGYLYDVSVLFVVLNLVLLTQKFCKFVSLGHNCSMSV